MARHKILIFPWPMTFEKLEFSLEQSKQKSNEEKPKASSGFLCYVHIHSLGMATAGRFICGDGCIVVSGVPRRSPGLRPGNARRRPLISVARCSLVANLAGARVCDARTDPSAEKIMMTKMFYAKGFLSQGTPLHLSQENHLWRF